MHDTPVSIDIEFPPSFMFERMRAVARLLGLAVSIEGSFLSFALDTSASSRTPSWSAGEITRAEHLSGAGPVPGGLACPAIFGDLHTPNLCRIGHIALPCFIVPWPARQLLATLLDETEADVRALNAEDPDHLLARIQAADAAGQTVLGRSPVEFAWWSIPVMAPILRAEDPEVAAVMEGQTCFTHALHDAYRRVTNRAWRLRRLMELDAPAVILDNERRWLVGCVDELLVNADLEEPRVFSDDASDGSARAFDATTLFFAALGSEFVEIGERNAATAAGAKSWIAKAAQIGRKQVGQTPRLAALWGLAAERLAEPFDDEMLKEMVLSGLPDASVCPPRSVR